MKSVGVNWSVDPIPKAQTCRQWPTPWRGSAAPAKPAGLTTNFGPVNAEHPEVLAPGLIAHQAT
jgi:hypothetical protein